MERHYENQRLLGFYDNPSQMHFKTLIILKFYFVTQRHCKKRNAKDCEKLTQDPLY